MAGLFSKLKKVLLGKEDSKEITDSIKEFNTMTASYLNVLEEKVDHKEKKVSRIRVLVNKMMGSRPDTSPHSINVQILDINNTKVTERGKGSYNQQMDWEQKMRDYRRQNPGTII